MFDLGDNYKSEIRQSMHKLEQLAEKARQAGPLQALPAARALGEEQLNFNRLIAGVLCR